MLDNKYMDVKLEHINYIYIEKKNLIDENYLPKIDLSDVNATKPRNDSYR